MYSFAATSVTEANRLGIFDNFSSKREEFEKAYPVSKLLDSIRPKGVLIEDIAEGAEEAINCLEISGEVLIFEIRGSIPTATIYLERNENWLEVRELLREAGLSR